MKSAFLNEEVLKEKPESEDYILKMSRDALERMEKSKSVRRYLAWLILIDESLSILDNLT